MSDAEHQDSGPPTEPPGPDPVVECFEKIDKKLDGMLAKMSKLGEAVEALTDEVFRLRDKEVKQDEEIGLVKDTVRRFTPAAGMPAVRPNGNGQ